MQWQKPADGRRVSSFHARGSPGLALRKRFRPQIESLENRTLLSAGDLDPTFGTGGKVTTDFGSSSFDAANAVALQSDGKIVLVGRTASTATGNSAFAMARYRPDGTLDTTFGTGGKVTTNFGSLTASASGVAIQADGKIVVAGAAVDAGTGNGQVVAARYDAGGALDATFGSGGIVTGLLTAMLPGRFVSAFALQADGKLVLARVNFFAGSTTTLGNYFAMARLNPDGTLDNTFATLEEHPGFARTAPASISRLLLQADGKIVAVRTDVTQRYNPDGRQDFAYRDIFGTGADSIAAAIQPDDRIVVAGPSLSLQRYNSNAALDTTFASASQGTSSAADMLVQPDGRIAVTGSSGAGAFVLARANPNGSADVTFGTNGKVTTNFSTGSTDNASGVVRQSDGKIIVVGTTSTNNGDFALARYLGDDPVANANQRFVSQVYLDLLQRPADASGLNFWKGLLDQGMSRTQVVFQIESSPEYHALEVQRLYGLILGRPVESSGQTVWTSFLNQGGTAEQLEVTLLGSAEYLARAGGTNDGFLQGLYRDTLGRSVDPAGASTWGQALAQSVPRSAVAAAILASLESDRLEVQGMYRQFLRRAADDGGLNLFTGALQQGVPNEQILVLLVGSNEYFSRL